MNIVCVMNKGAPFTGRYDGIDYPFPTDETVTIPVAAAAHIFGYGHADKKHALVRHGWMQTGADHDKALARLGEFVFEEPELAIPDLSKSAGDQGQGEGGDAPGTADESEGEDSGEPAAAGRGKAKRR